METILDQSYGVIPLRKEDDQWKVFLIHQYGSAGDVYWTFPKGHAEGDETPQEAALRELLEETGLLVSSLYQERTYMSTYTYVHENVQIEKTASYYVGEVADPKWTVQEDEVKEAGWFPLKEARELLSFEASKDILDQVEKVHCT